MSARNDPPKPRLGLLAGFFAATAFLTRLPTGRSATTSGRLAETAWAFPLVGAGIGALAAFAYLLAEIVGLGNGPASLAAVLAGIAVTGALHEDGLADAADGLLGGQDREARLAVMRDSRHGTFGVLALVLSVALRAAALTAIGQTIFATLALIAAHAASRAALPVVMRVLVPARTDGLGATAGTPSRLAAGAAALIGIALLLAALGPWRGLFALGLMPAAVAATAALAHRRIGGYTGDVLGAVQQIGEITMLIAAAAR